MGRFGRRKLGATSLGRLDEDQLADPSVSRDGLGETKSAPGVRREWGRGRECSVGREVPTRGNKGGTHSFESS